MENQYVRVDCPDEATHWIPTEDDRFKVNPDWKVKLFSILAKFSPKYDYAHKLMTLHNDSLFTVGRKYRVYVNPMTEEIDVIDDRNRRGELWLIHKGYFVKELY